MSSVVYMVSAILEAHFTSTSDLVLAHITSPHHKLHSMVRSFNIFVTSLPLEEVNAAITQYASNCSFFHSASEKHLSRDEGLTAELVPKSRNVGKTYVATRNMYTKCELVEARKNRFVCDAGDEAGVLYVQGYWPRL